MAVVQSQGNKLLKASIHLLMHSGILRHDLANLLEQPRTAVVVVALRILQALSVVRFMVVVPEGPSTRFLRPRFSFLLDAWLEVEVVGEVSGELGCSEEV